MKFAPSGLTGRLPRPLPALRATLPIGEGFGGATFQAYFIFAQVLSLRRMGD